MSVKTKADPVWTSFKLLASTMVAHGDVDSIKYVSNTIESLKLATELISEELIENFLCDDKTCVECSDYRGDKLTPKLKACSERMIKISGYIEKRCERYKPEVLIDLKGYREFLKLCEQTESLKELLETKEVSAKEAVLKLAELERQKDKLIEETEKEVADFLARRIRVDLTPEVLDSKCLN